MQTKNGCRRGFFARLTMPTNPYQPPGTEMSQDERQKPATRKRLWIVLAIIVVVAFVTVIAVAVRQVREIYRFYGEATEKSRQMHPPKP
jgi:flagellar basal body-associated protein FliL